MANRHCYRRLKSRQAAKQNNSPVSGLVEMKGEKKSSMP
jgi:hypothetical protein